MGLCVQRLLIVGLGDVAKRTLSVLQANASPSWDITVLTRSQPEVVQSNIEVLEVDMDAWALSEAQQEHLAQPFDAVLYTVPPSDIQSGKMAGDDARLHRLLDFWRSRHIAPKKVVYISTTGVYGDCKGAWIDEQQPVKPESPRARRRVVAEVLLRDWSKSTDSQVTVLRAPGIYALERLPYASVLSGSPVLSAEYDSYSNHIHADDLARACVFFLNAQHDEKLSAFQLINVCDDEPLLMGQWMDALAEILGLAQPQALSREQMQALISPIRWSFMRESRRIRNDQLKTSGFALKYPSALKFLRDHADDIRAYVQAQHAGDRS